MAFKTIHFMKFDSNGEETVSGTMGLKKARDFEGSEEFKTFVRTANKGMHIPSAGHTNVFWVESKDKFERISIVMRG